MSDDKPPPVVAHYLFNFTRGTRRGGTRLRGPLIPPAKQLVDVGMWGITEANPHRLRLAARDRVLIYVGAPENTVIARATIGTAWHPWTEDEPRRYPREFTAGVVFAEAKVFERPVLLRSLLTELSFGQSNPGLMFRSGVVRIEQGDYEAVLRAAGRTRRR